MGNKTHNYMLNHSTSPRTNLDSLCHIPIQRCTLFSQIAARLFCSLSSLFVYSEAFTSTTGPSDILSTRTRLNRLLDTCRTFQTLCTDASCLARLCPTHYHALSYVSRTTSTAVLPNQLCSEQLPPNPEACSAVWDIQTLCE